MAAITPENVLYTFPMPCVATSLILYSIHTPNFGPDFALNSCGIAIYFASIDHVFIVCASQHLQLSFIITPIYTGTKSLTKITV